MHRHLTLAGLCLAVFLAMAGVGMAAAALPEKYLLASGTVRSAGWLSSFFAISYMACQYPAGRIVDNVGYRAVLACGFLLMALAAATYTLAETTTGIYVGRFIQGAGEAPVWASAPALLGRLHPDGRGRAMGCYNAAFHVGLMLGPLAGCFPALARGDNAFTAFAWLGLASAALAWTTTGTHVPSGSAPARAVSLAATFRGIRLAACSLPLFGAAYGLLTSSLPVFLVHDAGLGRERLGAFLFSAYLGLSLAQYGAGRLSDRFGRTPFLAAGLAATGLGLAGAVLGRADLLLLSAALLGLGLGAFGVASMALVNEHAPEGGQGTASGQYYLIWGTGYCAGPLLANAAGMEGCAVLLAAAMLMLAALFAPAMAARRRTPDRD